MCMPAFLTTNGETTCLRERRGTNGCNMRQRACSQRSRIHLLLYIPGFNGYRRLQPGSYAPTRIAWGRNNRSVVVRVPASDDKARRLEHRMSGADANPYFVLAGVLGGMLEGLENAKLPPPPVEGNAYNVPLPQLSDDMDDAIEDFERSDFIRRLFGPELRKIFAEIKREELSGFRQ
jgi:glutamine synthetase